MTSDRKKTIRIKEDLYFRLVTLAAREHPPITIQGIIEKGVKYFEERQEWRDSLVRGTLKELGPKEIK